jgi:PAS domain S-box-containing protein
MNIKEKQELLDEIAKYKEEIEFLKEKQKSLESIIEDSATALIIGNNKGQIIKANKKALELSQFSIDEITNKKVNELLISESIPVSFSRKDFKEPSSEFSSEHILLRKDGKKLYVSTRTKLLSDKNYQILINNINKRKKAELALVESEKRYRLLTENIHDVVWTCSIRLKTIFVSASIVKITGFTPEVYYLKPLSELITPISLQLIKDTIRKEREKIKTGAFSLNKYSISLEIKLLRKEFKSIWVELTSTVIQNQFGEIVGFQGVLRNIDSHKKTLEILDKNKLKYNFALKSTDSGVWELDGDLTKINIDENLVNLLGYTTKELKPFLNDWISLTYKDDRLAVIDFLQDLLDGKKMTMSYECRRIHKNGKILWFKDYVQAVPNAEGRTVELIGTSKNITEEKRTEEKKYKYFAGLQMLINSTFHFLKLSQLDQIYDYTGRVLLQNIPNSIIIFCTINPVTSEAKPFKFYGVNEPRFLKQIETLNYNPYSSSVKLSQPIFKMLEREMLIEHKGGFKDFVKSIFSPEDSALINKTFNLSNLHLIGSLSDHQLNSGIIIIFREETELQNKEFIEAFISLSSIIINKKKTEIQLKKLNTTKDKFFSIISHDLKNPFNTFIGFSGLMIQNIDKISKEKVLEFAKLIHNSALQSYEMMQNLFEWVISQKSGIEVKPVLFNISALIGSNIKLFSGDAIKKGITIKLISDNDFEFYADIDMMNTIFRNLISNAIKFTNKDGLIQISYRINEKAVQFEVEDNGIGIPKKDQIRIFNIDTNKSTIGTENEKGTGLGLVLCHEFVEQQGGQIWVESEEGKGSKFIFYIPLDLNIRDTKSDISVV